LLIFEWLAAAGALAAPDDGLPPPVAAEETTEIIVTGERVPRSLRETPSSVAVVTSAELESHAAPDRLEQLLDHIPNVQLGGGGDGPTIRGLDTTGPTRDLPAFLGGIRPRTTLVVDGRAVSFHEFVFGAAPVWDLESLEVFRTPQTTTQGRNSIAGAIFLNTIDPSFGWEGRARAIGGDLDTRHVSALVSGPLVADQVAFRLTGDYRKSRTSNVVTNVVEGTDFNNDEYGQVRLKLLARPDVLPGARAEITYAHIESQSPTVEGVQPPFRERRALTGGNAAFGTNVDSLTADVSYDPAGPFSVQTVLSHGDAAVRRFATPGLGVARIHYSDWSAEAVVRWDNGHGIEATGGASHTRVALDQLIDLSLLSGIGDFDDRQTGTGLFGEVAWRLFDRATLIAGLRYQRDGQQRVGFLQGRTAPIPLDYRQSFDAWLPKVSFAYDVTREVTVGALVQRAYNPGGVSLRFDIGEADEYLPERLWNYELVARASLIRGALSATANLFRYDMRDAQRSRPISIVVPGGGFRVGFADLFNVPRARVHGAELTLEWRASRRLSVEGSIGLLDTRITRTDQASSHLLGKGFQRSPPFSASAGIDWQPVDRVRLSAQLDHNAGYFSDETERPDLRVGGMTTINAKAAVEWGPVTAFAYARNLLDEFALRALLTPTLAVASDPREVGFGLEAGF
jgi:outer membrane receptor protein involved in Fe transport